MRRDVERLFRRLMHPGVALVTGMIGALSVPHVGQKCCLVNDDSNGWSGQGSGVDEG